MHNSCNNSVTKVQVIQALRNIKIDENGIEFYSHLISNIRLSYEGKYFSYEKGLPHGSIISPMLFALVYEGILREAIANNWCVWAYADDVAIAVETQEEYTKVITWLDTWNQKVNKNKTKEIRIGEALYWPNKFDVVEFFKYLGVNVYSHRIKSAVKSHIKDQLDKMRIKCEKIRFTNKGASRQSWI